MLKHLFYTVRFATTGRVLEESLDFEKGTTAITGPNEVGKSMVVEMIRYAFFGTDALRGVASDYADLKVGLAWKDFRIDRNGRNAKMWRGTELIATGTKPVNLKVLEILGFGLDVFDIACVCNQGDVERLGNLKPMERKRMVDRVIGADRIEELQKWAGEQALLLNREVETLERGLVEPEVPSSPAGYIPSARLGAEVAAKRTLATEAAQLRGWLSQVRTGPTLAPKPDGDLEDLEALLVKIDQEQAARVHLMQIPVVDFDAEKVRWNWEVFDLWTARLAFEKAHPHPRFLIDDITRTLGVHEREKQIKRLKDSRPQGTSVTCPHCSGEFCLEHKTLAEIDREIERLENEWREGMQRGVAIASDAELQDDLRRYQDWASPETKARFLELVNAFEVPRPLVTREELAKATLGITTAERERRLSLIPNSGSRVQIEPKLRALRAWQSAVEVYERDKAAFDAWCAERDTKTARLAEIEPQIADLSEIERKLVEAGAYEGAMNVFEQAKIAFDQRAAEVAEKKESLQGWRAARDALAELRAKVKTYLVPSLNKVASHLLSQMTGGQRSSIVVDEEFNVVVDGQRLETLSGSGKACANLALRIGLGQVLTNNVVSLFIGDEIDASMDATRAENTHSSVGRLTAAISQILLITHKLPVADNVIALGTGADEGRVRTRSAA